MTARPPASETSRSVDIRRNKNAAPVKRLRESSFAFKIFKAIQIRRGPKTLLFHRLHKRGFVFCLEECAACDEDVCTCCGAEFCSLSVDAAVNLQLAAGIFSSIYARIACTLGIMSAMKLCPPKPGSTVMTRIRSTRPMNGRTASAGVLGLTQIAGFCRRRG